LALEWGSGARGFQIPAGVTDLGELARLTRDEASPERALRKAHRLVVELGATAGAEQIAGDRPVNCWP
jgi:hypothetical protein